MGLIKAFGHATGGAMADQWREFFYGEAMTKDVLVEKGQKRVSGKRSANKKGEENIISNGSIVAVNDGQFMIIVDQGKVVEFCGEPGEFVYDTSSEPSLLYGSFGQQLLETFKTVGKRFTFSGDTAKDQRVYYFNVKEIMGNKYGTANPVPFRVVDKNIGLDIDIAIRCNGEYSYRIMDPLLFYSNVCGNVAEVFLRSEIDSQLKSELLTAMQPAFAKISEMGIRYSALPSHSLELSEALNEILSGKWSKLRGIEIVSFGVNALKASEEDENLIKELQKSAVFRDTTMAGAALVGAQADAMRAAAANETAGPMMAFAGLNMAGAAGGMNANNLFAMGANNAQTSGQASGQANVSAGNVPAMGVATGATLAVWACGCGEKNNAGKFCRECGKQKPIDASGWTCACGNVNKARFCGECGTKKPEFEASYQCDKCGWEPEDVTKPPRFCPECGDVFDEGDVKK